MANTSISNLTASASNLASTDLAPVVQTAGVGPVKMTGAQIAAGLLSATTPIGSGPILSAAAAATLQLGAADAAAPVAQTFKVQGVVSGTSNTAGANFTIQGSQGTGTGAGGSIIFQVAPAGSSGTAQNAYSTALTLASDKTATFANSVSVTGAVTCTQAVNVNAAVATILSTQATEVFGRPGGTSDTLAIGKNAYWQRIDLYANNAIAASAVASGFSIGSGGDVILARDAANTLALRNGTNAQTFNVYETYISASDYSRLSVSYDSGTSAMQIATAAAGSGSARNITISPANGALNIVGASINMDSSRQLRWGTSPTTYIVPRAANDINFGLNAASPVAVAIGAPGARDGTDSNTAGANFILRGGLGTGTANGGDLQFSVSLPSGASGNSANAVTPIAYFAGASGHMLWNTDNTYDIGAATTTRPRNVFIAGYEQMTEMTAPAAPAANSVRIYAEDNGSGKTRLMALFATGAAQQIAIEP